MRFSIAEYGLDEANEVFTMDDIGNRSNGNVRDESEMNYVVDNLTNRYDSRNNVVGIFSFPFCVT